VVWGVNRRLDIAEKMGVEFAVDPKVEAGRCDVVLVSVPIEKNRHLRQRYGSSSPTNSTA